MATTEIATPTSRPQDSFHPVGDWSQTIDELLKIHSLENDWDGEGTEAPNRALVAFAIALAQADQARGVPPPDRVHAGVNATVYFEWLTPAGYCEIEVLSPVDAEYRFVREGSNRTEVLRLSRRG